MYQASNPPSAALHTPPCIPNATHAQVWIDFDGTLTRSDLLDDLIVRYSRNESWRLVEERWRLGLIGSRECLQQEFALLDITSAQLRAELARVELDPGALTLLSYLRRAAVPVTVLSDGVEGFIRVVLARAGVRDIAIRANAAAHRGRSLNLRCRDTGTVCHQAAAHCKCSSRASLSLPGRSCIYIGDGRSDLCVARSVECVFAKGALADAFTHERRSFQPFQSLLDVHAALAGAWGSTR